MESTRSQEHIHGQKVEDQPGVDLVRSYVATSNLRNQGGIPEKSHTNGFQYGPRYGRLMIHIFTMVFTTVSHTVFGICPLTHKVWLSDPVCTHPTQLPNSTIANLTHACYRHSQLSPWRLLPHTPHPLYASAQCHPTSLYTPGRNPATSWPCRGNRCRNPTERIQKPT